MLKRKIDFETILPQKRGKTPHFVPHFVLPTIKKKNISITFLTIHKTRIWIA